MFLLTSSVWPIAGARNFVLIRTHANGYRFGKSGTDSQYRMLNADSIQSLRGFWLKTTVNF